MAMSPPSLLPRRRDRRSCSRSRDRVPDSARAPQTERALHNQRCNACSPMIASYVARTAEPSLLITVCPIARP